MEAHILKMKDLVNNLAAAGDDVSETDLISYIFGGLEPDYEPIANILGIKPEQFTIEEAQNHLIDYETKLAQLHTLVTINLGNSSSANFVSEKYLHSRQTDVFNHNMSYIVKS